MVFYRFTSLSSLADYLMNYGREINARAEKAKPKERDLLKREASTYTIVSDLVRRTVIRGEKEP